MKDTRSAGSNYVLKFIKYAFIFAAALLVMEALLVLAAMIPQEKIQSNALESAGFLADGELFGYAVDGVEGSCIDRYADSILLNIAYHYDAEHPVKSVLLSAYYFTPYHEENENFLEAVSEKKAANQQYLRYWHGSIALIRPLLTVMPVDKIYMLNAAVLAILLLVFIYVSVKNGRKMPAVSMIIGLVITGSWFVPLSLEYTWNFMVLFISSAVAVNLAAKRKRESYVLLFLLTGMVTSYLDFLTTETMTLLVPLIIILWKDRQERASGTFIRSVISWSCGYVFMWISKWVITGIVLGEDPMPYVAEHIGERLSGNVGVDRFSFITGAVTRNIGCLFPVGYGTAGMIAAIVLLVVTAYIGFVYRRKPYDMKCIRLLIIAGLIPYIRYLVLHNHSYLHCFFTYRAQIATVMAVVFIIAELIGRSAAEVDNGK